jgi:hypothetical protein
MVLFETNTSGQFYKDVTLNGNFNAYMHVNPKIVENFMCCIVKIFDEFMIIYKPKKMIILPNIMGVTLKKIKLINYACKLITRVVLAKCMDFC